MPDVHLPLFGLGGRAWVSTCHPSDGPPHDLQVICQDDYLIRHLRSLLLTRSCTSAGYLISMRALVGYDIMNCLSSSRPHG